MKRKDFLKGLGVIPASFLASGMTGWKFREIPNVSEEEFNQDGYYWENGKWVMRAVCVRVTFGGMKNGEITIDRNGKVIKKKWLKPYHTDVKGRCAYMKPKYKGKTLPKEARVCYNTRECKWRISDAPDSTRDKLVSFTWKKAPLVKEGENIPVVGMFI